MSVQSVERRVQRRTTQLIDGTKIAEIAITVVQVLAGALWFASWFGSYVAFAGGWLDNGAPPVDLVMLALSLVYQSIVSILQWGFSMLAVADRRWWVAYIVALIFSVLPTIDTYHAWAGDMIARSTGSPLIALFIISLASIGADWMPEYVLMKRGSK